MSWIILLIFLVLLILAAPSLAGLAFWVWAAASGAGWPFSCSS